MKIRNHKEHGQVIFILAIGIISLLGFTALAVDGARLFSERRTAQGVADTAAFTAAAYIGQYQVPYIENNWMNEKDGDTDYNDGVEPHAEQAALERIRSNGYTDASYDPFGGNDRLRITINPVYTGPITQYLVRVTMISEVQPIFAQLVYHGDLLVNVESHAIVMPRSDLAFGNALYSLDDSSDCKAIKIQGNSDTYIVGAGIHSNSTCSDSAVDISGSAVIDLSGIVSAVGGIEDGGASTYTSGGEVEGAAPLPIPNVPIPDCGTTAGVVVDDHVGTVTFFPGIYNKKVIITSAKNQQIFQPGLYCFNAGVQITNGNITGNGVTFYLPDDDFTVTGGVLNLVAPQNGEADDGTNVWDGMLFYVKEGKWLITANSGSSMEGTVYAPGDPDPTCQLTGSGLTDGYNLQLICNTISLIGGSGLNIVFDNTNTYIAPVSIDLIE